MKRIPSIAVAAIAGALVTGLVVGARTERGSARPIPPMSAAPDAVDQPTPSLPSESATAWAKFVGENRDPVWAATARKQLDSALRAGLRPGTSIRDVECREELCRVDITNDSIEDATAFHDALRAARPWNGAVLMTSSGDSKPDRPFEHLVMFIAREGVARPFG